MNEIYRIRTVITLLVMGVVSYLVIVGKIDPSAYLALAGSVMTYYFCRERFGEDK